MEVARDRDMALFDWMPAKKRTTDPFADAVDAAERVLVRAAAAGLTVPEELSKPILLAREALATGVVALDPRQHFFAAYGKLVKFLAEAEYGDGSGSEETFEGAQADAELLVKLAAESGIDVPESDAKLILRAASAQPSGDPGAHVAFYSAYTRLVRLFGDGVTAQTIRNCSSALTQAKLRRDRLRAAWLTAAVVVVSVFTFMAESMSKSMLQDIVTANDAAAQLRLTLTTIPERYAADDPCKHLPDDPEESTHSTENVKDHIHELQQFAITIRDILGRATKLNWIAWVECSPLAKCYDYTTKSEQPPMIASELQKSYLELNPALRDYTAEVLCKIESYQLIRSFATNVQADYAAMVGAFTGFVLPILYSWLGAYAYRLRLFSETIRKRTYHPSFSDSSRMVTAIIAGAIAGLFNPANNLALSPLATAFLIGYGVELFFKFLDTLVAAFGSSSSVGRRPIAPHPPATTS